MLFRSAFLDSFMANDKQWALWGALLALVGVWSLAPDRFWGGRPTPLRQADPNGALTLLAQLLPPVGIVVGIYILWEGADQPGGAFLGRAGGVEGEEAGEDFVLEVGRPVEAGFRRLALVRLLLNELGRGPAGQWYLRSLAPMGASLMLAMRRCISPSPSNSQFSLP